MHENRDNVSSCCKSSLLNPGPSDPANIIVAANMKKNEPLHEDGNVISVQGIQKSIQCNKRKCQQSMKEGRKKEKKERMYTITKLIQDWNIHQQTMKNSKYTGKAVCALSCRQKNA
jgi:hypothetical protein